MNMQKVTIDRYRIVPAPQTGIGWVAVQEWDNSAGEYKHVSTFRSRADAKLFSKQHDVNEETDMSSLD
jgi:hypothetical protein